MQNLAAPLALAAALACAPAFGQGWYIGAGIGQGDVDFQRVAPGVSIDDKDTTYQVRLGYRFHRNLGVELGYYNMGEYGLSASTDIASFNISAKARSVGLSLVGTLPLERFDVYGRLGYARSEIKASAVGLGLGFTDAFGFGFGSETRSRENEWFGAVGARFNFSRDVGVFAEYQQHDKLEIDGLFVGVDIRF